MERRRRAYAAFITLLIVAGGAIFSAVHTSTPPADNNATVAQSQVAKTSSSPAITALGKLAVKGRAPQTGYARTKFSDGWANAGECDMREKILNRDLIDVKDRSSTDCNVVTGMLHDPYTGKTIHFVRGPGTSTAVQIDHVVAVSNAWQTGAQQLSATTRKQLYNDPLELLAVDGPANDQKGDGDAATWLPSNKSYRCRYAARQIAVKLKYDLWVTAAEHDALQRVLGSCPDQVLPVVNQ